MLKPTVTPLLVLAGIPGPAPPLLQLRPVPPTLLEVSSGSKNCECAPAATVPTEFSHSLDLDRGYPGGF